MNLALARKWRSLGIPVMGMQLRQIDEDLKFAAKVEDLEEEELEISRSEDYNCLALFISDTPLMCLDVDNEGDSIPNFLDFLKANGSDISDFLYETTVNGSYHIYFLKDDEKSTIFKSHSDGINFDVLVNGRVFTSPTFIGTKKYRFGKRTPLQLRSLDEIGKMPDFIKSLVSKGDSYKTPESIYF
jgi:hypothetical protein